MHNRTIKSTLIQYFDFKHIIFENSFNDFRRNNIIEFLKKHSSIKRVYLNRNGGLELFDNELT